MPRKEFTDLNQSKLDEYSEELNFTGDEYWGKYIDIHPCYSQYINLPSIKKYAFLKVGFILTSIDYVDYLSFFYKFDAIPLETKLDYVQYYSSSLWIQNYSVYIQSLYDYFIHYFKRVQPLFEVERFIQDLIPAFEEKWARGDVCVPFLSAYASSWWAGISFVLWLMWICPSMIPSRLLNLSVWFLLLLSIHDVGMEQCKSLLMQLGLKCGYE